MAKIAVVDEKGKTLEELNVADKILAAAVNQSLIHLVVRAHLAEERRGTADVKHRGEVRGGGVKPWRQKGTGRARAGSIRSPIWKGGGVTFGPTPRDFTVTVPKKARRQALKSVLSDKIKHGNVRVVSDLIWKAPKTKQAVALLDKLGMEGKILAIFRDEAEAVTKSFANLPEVKIISADQVNVYDLLNSDEILTTKAVFESMCEERLS